MQLGGMLPNLANLTLMSITPQNGMIAITQSTELFSQVPVDNEQIVTNPAPRTLPRNPTPQKQREHHLSSSSDSSSSSSETDDEPPPKRPQKKKDGKKERSSAAKELARPPANEWHNNLVPLNKLASLSTSQISKLDDVNEVDDQIRDLTPEIDDINLPFQGEGLAKKVPPGAKFGDWVISRKSGMTGFEINNMCRAMGRFAGLKYDRIEANDKPNYMTRATYAAVLVHRPWLVAQIMDIPRSTLRKRVKVFAKKVMDLAKQTTLANLMLRLRLTVNDTDYLASLISENASP